LAGLYTKPIESSKDLNRYSLTHSIYRTTINYDNPLNFVNYTSHYNTADDVNLSPRKKFFI